MTFVELREKIFISRKERVSGIFIFLSAAILIFLDILEDRLDGVPIVHLATEFVLFSFSLFGVFYLYFKTSSRMYLENKRLSSNLSELCKDFDKWKDRTKGIYRALSEEINKQFAE